MTLAEFVRKALTVPFTEHGRDYTGWDCWGVVCCAYRDVLGIDLPTLIDDYTVADVQGSPALAKVVVEQLPNWQLVREPQKLDVALFRIAGRPVHVGLMLDHRFVLHAERKIGTFVERIDSAMWQKRLEGVYRHGE